MKILYLCHRIPFPPDKGDKIRSYHQLRYLAERHEVDLFTLVDDEADRRHIPELKEMANQVVACRLRAPVARLFSARALLTGESISAAYFRSCRLKRAVHRALGETEYDVVFVYSSAMGPYVTGWDGRLVLDFVDVDSAKWLAYAEQGGAGLFRWIYRREGRVLRSLEADLAGRAALTLVCTPREEEELRSFCEPRNLATVGNGTDTDYFSPGETDLDPFDVVFTGAMDYRANVDAVLWFCEEVFPQLQSKRPGCQLIIVGSNPVSAVRRLADTGGVEVTGRVPDVRPYLRAARVAVAPLRVARGVQNKVLEALSCEVPVVATSHALGGLEESRGVVQEDDPVNFAAAVISLLENETARVELGQSGRQYVAENYRWEKQLEKLENLMIGGQ